MAAFHELGILPMIEAAGVTPTRLYYRTTRGLTVWSEFVGGRLDCFTRKSLSTGDVFNASSLMHSSLEPRNTKSTPIGDLPGSGNAAETLRQRLCRPAVIRCLRMEMF